MQYLLRAFHYKGTVCYVVLQRYELHYITPRLMARKRAENSVSHESAMISIVAVHRTVSERLNYWASEPTWSKAGVKFKSTIELLKKGKVKEAELLFDSLRRDFINDSGGVREYGPNQKGGAPRLFVLHKLKSYFYVAAGLEEGNRGCPEVDDARKRGLQLSRLKPQSSVEGYREALGPDYEVWPIPSSGTRETR